MHATLLENCDIFDTGVGVLPAVTVIEAEIPLKSEHVVCYDPRVFLSPLQQDIAEPILENMCERGILEEIDHSNSLVPLLLVKKKRMDSDYLTPKADSRSADADSARDPVSRLCS